MRVTITIDFGDSSLDPVVKALCELVGYQNEVLMKLLETTQGTTAARVACKGLEQRCSTLLEALYSVNGSMKGPQPLSKW